MQNRLKIVSRETILTEKIIQAKTHVIQVKFTDAFKAVAKNKYFWIISLAGWIGFLETAYTNILAWLYNYGGACSGNMYSLIVTLNGNSALWGMIMAPFFIRKYGKKNVQIVTNLLNIIFILAMIIFTGKITPATITFCAVPAGSCSRDLRRSP